MLFNSIEFLVFLPVVTAVFYLLPHRFRWMWLLAASCFFYMWFIPKYILILLVTILIDYCAALLMERWSDKPVHRRWCMLASVVSTCAVLFIFKYLNFCSENLVALAQHFGWAHPKRVLDIALPIGLSFHTFQSLSYVIEVYRGRQRAERHLGYYALYVMFYPQLVTGPIERPQNLLRQLHEEKTLQHENITRGLRLVLYGLFLKIVVADNIGAAVDAVYAAPADFGRAGIVTAMALYSMQIYGDFFGYSTIALGCARLMGFSLVDNFKAPYLAESIGDFWRRWHISLSSWLRDYIYIPLGGNRVSVPRWMLNTLVVFTVCGIWHGANWTFLLWGVAYGVLVVLSKLLHRSRQAGSLWSRLGGIAVTFAVVTLMWTLFRAPSLGDLHSLYAALLHGGGTAAVHLAPQVWIALAVFVAIDIATRNSRFDVWCSTLPRPLRWLLYGTIVFAIIAFGSVEQHPFIYFQF